MKMETKFRRAMEIPDEGKRLAALENIALSICWHGGTWLEVMEQIKLLRARGVKTPLQKSLEDGKGFGRGGNKNA